MRDDRYDLARFVTAQGPVYETVLRELRAGKKSSHWMWFIFPQLRGLGRSSTAQFFGVTSLSEARAYVEHALLGPRLYACTELVLASRAPSLLALFGSPDDLKFHSCMTLFAHTARPADSIFERAIAQGWNGKDDARTSELLRESQHARNGGQ